MSLLPQEYDDMEHIGSCTARDNGVIFAPVTQKEGTMNHKGNVTIVAYLKNKWDALFKEGTDNNLIFTQIIDKYMERGLTAYHTVEHLAHMFQLLDFASPGMTLEEKQELSLAIFYHDSFQDERESKDFMRRSLTRARGIKGDIDKIAQLILATDGHEHTGEFFTDLLIDLDLSILGSEPGGYEGYMMSLSEEFVPEMGEEAYKSARLGFLKKMMARDNIFMNKVFVDAFEYLARANMSDEIDELEGGW